MDAKDYRVDAVLGDGEVAEGQIWEAAMSAAKYQLSNLCAFVDVNGLQIDGKTSDVMPTEPLDQKFAAFNWNVLQVDGHDYAAIADVLAEARACTDRADRHPGPYRQGQGRVLHGERCRWYMARRPTTSSMRRPMPNWRPS